MTSHFLECQVMHQRFHPQAHAFRHRIFMLSLDLDELAMLSLPLRLLKINGPGLLSFRERDYLPSADAATPALPLKARVIEHLRTRGVEAPIARVQLITMPCVAGYLFNPVSFYYCFDPAGSPVAAVVEVTNTFREVKLYTLDRRALQGGRFHLRTPKHFYVSPYSDVDVSFDFSLHLPGRTVRIQIDDFTETRRTLTSTVVGRPSRLDAAHVLWFSLKYPFLTAKVMTLIHWHALRLWLKRVPWFAKSARTADQRDVLRPHVSLRAVPAAKPL